MNRSKLSEIPFNDNRGISCTEKHHNARVHTVFSLLLLIMSHKDNTIFPMVVVVNSLKYRKGGLGLK